MKFKLKQIFYILYLPYYITEVILFKIFQKKNTNLSYHAMVNYFCLTGGWSNNLLHNFLKKRKKKENTIYEIENLRRDGFLVKKKYLGNDDVKNFFEELSNINGYWLGDKYKSTHKEILSSQIKSTKYFYESEDLIKLKSVQSILMDKNLMDIAREYLEAEPILYNINCWYNFPSLEPDSNAAQLWHFDMDRPKWIKLFFYLTDCNEDNGPHCFVKGSHSNNSIPIKLRKLGYSRISDNQVEEEFEKKDLLEHSFNKGDLIIEDSRGLHKGKKVISKYIGFCSK